jgi:hypothetical protein
MTPRLYFDEDSMDRSLVRALRARNVDVETAFEAGMIERPDSDHLEYATARERVLVSFNVGDFYRLHTQLISEGRTHAGLALARQQHYSVGGYLRRLLTLIATLSAEQMRGRVEFLSHWG